MPCIPIRLQLMSQRMTVTRNAAISPGHVPSMNLTKRNAVTIPNNPNATLANLPVVIARPPSFIRTAMGMRNIDGRLVDGT